MIPRKPLYTSDIVNRIVKHVNERIAYEAKHYRRDRRFTMWKLSADTGIPYHVLRNVFRRKEGDAYLRKPPWAMMDTVLYALDKSVLDFLEPNELANAFNKLDETGRFYFRQYAKHDPLIPKSVGKTRSTKTSETPEKTLDV